MPKIYEKAPREDDVPAVEKNARETRSGKEKKSLPFSQELAFVRRNIPGT